MELSQKELSMVISCLLKIPELHEMIGGTIYVLDDSMTTQEFLSLRIKFENEEKMGKKMEIIDKNVNVILERDFPEKGITELTGLGYSNWVRLEEAKLFNIDKLLDLTTPIWSNNDMDIFYINSKYYARDEVSIRVSIYNGPDELGETNKSPHNHVTIDIDADFSDPKSIEALKSFNLEVKGNNITYSSYNLMGNKLELIGYLTSDFYGLDMADVKESYPELF